MRIRNIARLFRNKLFTEAQVRPQDPVVSSQWQSSPEFGLFFDIDGVLVRGRTVLPHTREAFQLLTHPETGHFLTPTIFCTNAGNTLRRNKAQQLTKWLGVEIASNQVIMSHSPLKMFHQFLDKHVLVSGQGPTKEIAEYLGFTKVTTIEQFRSAFPNLDMVDHKRRKIAPCAFEKYFPRIEAVILFGEPIRWETNLQLLLDILLTNGHPGDVPDHPPYPHIPILACNMDLMWMSEACMPRFAHGCFLHCLESLYQKITGYELKYTALVGKPSEITYHHSEHVLQQQAARLGGTNGSIRRMYCIGDNPDADIYGANLYNRYLQHKMEAISRRQLRQQQGSGGSSSPPPSTPETTPHKPLSRGAYLPDDSMDVNGTGASNGGGVERVFSILVETGVYSRARSEATSNPNRMLLDHNHRDFILDPELLRPTLTVPNVLEAIKAIYKMEGLDLNQQSLASSSSS